MDHAIPYFRPAAEPFQHLFAPDDEALKRHGALRRVTENSGYPCRVSLTGIRP